MLEKGIVSAIYNAFDHLYDKDKVLENDEEEKEKATKSYEFSVLYAKELIELTVYAMGVAAGWTGSAATKAMLIEIYEGTYDPDTTDDISGEVLWSAWLAFVVALIVSTAIMRVLSTIQDRRKAARREEMKKLAQGLCLCVFYIFVFVFDLIRSFVCFAGCMNNTYFAVDKNDDSDEEIDLDDKEQGNAKGGATELQTVASNSEEKKKEDETKNDA